MPSWGWWLFALWLILMAFGAWVVWDGRNSVRDIRAAGAQAVAAIQAAAEAPVLDDAAVKVLMAAGALRDLMPADRYAGLPPDSRGWAIEVQFRDAVDEWRATR